MSGLPNISYEDIEVEIRRRKWRRVDYFFPDTGALSWQNYPKQMRFFEATASNREVALMAANRVGKTEAGAYAVTCWATGEYPKWWKGRRFDKGVNVLICGETGKLVRDSLQKKLLGDVHNVGSGMLPKENIMFTTPKSGLPEAIDTVRVSGKYGESTIQFMSYDQGRAAFQATERDIVWEDEEPPLSVHAENLIRTMTTRGLVMLTFTPLLGLSDTVLSLQQKQGNGDCVIVPITWDEVPHLSEDDKSRMLEALPPFQRDARSRGIPSLGAGAIYPVREEDVVVGDFPIPSHFRRCYGLDVGWRATAASWLAHDADNDIVYIVGDYKHGYAEPVVHAAAIKARGNMPGLIDPASAGRGQADGKKVIELYRSAGLDLRPADNTVNAGLLDVLNRMTTGRLKIFKSCVLTMEELRIYRRNEQGLVVKENDHIMDAMRYGVRSGLAIARAIAEAKMPDPYAGIDTGGWMAN
jgi:phage terminase large subunit-like protein